MVNDDDDDDDENDDEEIEDGGLMGRSKEGRKVKEDGETCSHSC